MYFFHIHGDISPLPMYFDFFYFYEYVYLFTYSKYVALVQHLNLI